MLILCRDVFHCTPSALREQNPVDILTALTCLSVEARMRQ